jgi:RNA-directed DNA polymerase
LGDLPVSSCEIGCGLPDTKDQALAGTDAPANGANKHLVEEVAGDRGKPEIAREGLGRSLMTPFVPMKAGNAGADPGDPLEGRGEQTNVSDGGNMTILSDRENMSTKHTRIAELAKKDKAVKFTSIAHLLTQVALYEAFVSLRKDASAGVDGVTYAEYEVDAWENIRKLHDRQQSGQYRAQPLRRVYIPKEDGRQRPISIPSLEDKIVQKATVDLLNTIYEQDFLECSYGFRPGRGAQDALDEIGRVICTRPISTVLEGDITGYFDAIVRELLVEMIEKRVSDGSILRLIGKWINVGVIEDGRLLVSETGTGQGQVISPLLANIYLHYVLDVWFEKEVKPRLKGEAYEIRYADDFILCFQLREDAERVLDVLAKRFAKYGLKLHSDKTRLIEFGRQALAKSEKPGGQKPATFDFLGFTHICRRSRKGKFVIHVRTMRKRLKRSLTHVKAWCQLHRHDPVEEQQKALNRKLQGHYQYYGRPTNFRSLWEFYRATRRIWMYWLNRRDRTHSLTWTTFEHLLARYPLLGPRIVRPWAASLVSSV